MAEEKKLVSLRNALDEAVNVNFIASRLLIHFVQYSLGCEGGTQKALGLHIRTRWGVRRKSPHAGESWAEAAVSYMEQYFHSEEQFILQLCRLWYLTAIFFKNQ